jgi:hypothetical protein
MKAPLAGDRRHCRIQRRERNARGSRSIEIRIIQRILVNL